MQQIKVYKEYSAQYDTDVITSVVSWTEPNYNTNYNLTHKFNITSESWQDLDEYTVIKKWLWSLSAELKKHPMSDKQFEKIMRTAQDMANPQFTTMGYIKNGTVTFASNPAADVVVDDYGKIIFEPKHAYFGAIEKTAEEIAAAEAARELSRLSKQLPGVMNMIDMPCQCKSWKTTIDEFGVASLIQSDKPQRETVWATVQHLNDNHSDWTRERIADWIDKLQDEHGLNMEFQVKVDENE